VHSIRIITAFKWLTVNVFRIFEVCAAIHAHMPILALFAYLYPVFIDVPELGKFFTFYDVHQVGISYIAEGLLHAGAVLYIALSVNCYFAIEACIVMLTFCKKREVGNKRLRVEVSATCWQMDSASCIGYM